MMVSTTEGLLRRAKKQKRSVDSASYAEAPQRLHYLASPQLQSISKER